MPMLQQKVKKLQRNISITMNRCWGRIHSIKWLFNSHMKNQYCEEGFNFFFRLSFTLWFLVGEVGTKSPPCLLRGWMVAVFQEHKYSLSGPTAIPLFILSSPTETNGIIWEIMYDSVLRVSIWGPDYKILGTRTLFSCVLYCTEHYKLLNK